MVDLYARVSPRLATLPKVTAGSRAHARLYRVSGGRLGRRMLGADVVVLRTTGRRSGEPRESPLFHVRDGASYVVVASNAAAPAPPAWWLNLQARPEADVIEAGRRVPVRARRATAEEESRLWPRLVGAYRGYEHYKAIATREMPVVLLEPR